MQFDLEKTGQLMFVVSGLSGVGKDAIIRTVAERGRVDFCFVITTTSRPPRPEEVEAVDYFFVSEERFQEMIDEDELIEHAVVYGQNKGISKRAINTAMASARDIMIRVDYQGAERVREFYPKAVLIFMIPENVDVWVERLRARGSESEEELKIRIEKAKNELESARQIFDYVIINEDEQLNQAADVLEAIILAEHHRIANSGMI
jgi:guanylate kinase